jgi:hypothetical protein
MGDIAPNRQETKGLAAINGSANEKIGCVVAAHTLAATP